jgi:predicted Zn finger-like uncharacterized protein
MDYRCPVCGVDLPRRKLSHAIVARMEIDCPHCKTRIRLNVHQVEVAATVVHFGAILAFCVVAYLQMGQGLFLLTLAAAGAGALVVPLLDRTWLRTWPRYSKM